MKRVLSLVLALVLVLGMIPTFAAEMTGADHLYEHEFIAGDGTGNLMTEQLLTREQLAKLVLELNGTKEEAEVLTLPPSFTDAAKISAWARPYVAYAQIEGLMKGYTDNTFRPQVGVSGQQLAQVLTRALGYEFPWATVVADAADLGIEVATGAALTRGDAFEAMWATVNLPMKGETLPLGVKLGKLEDPTPKPVEFAVSSVSAENLKTMTVQLSKAADEDTVKASATAAATDTVRVYNASGNLVNVSASLSDDGKTLFVVSAVKFAQFGSFTLVVDGVKDEAGVAIKKYESTMTIKDSIQPQVVGAVATSMKTIEVTFSEPVAGLTNGTSKVWSEFKVGGINTFATMDSSKLDTQNKVTLTLGTKLAAGEYKLTVSGINDHAGFPVASTEITVVVASDTAAPTVTGVEYVDNKTVKVTFNEPVDPVTAGTASNYRIDGTAATTATKVSVTEYKLVLTNALTLAATVEAKLEVKNIKDNNDNAIADWTEFKFKATDDTTAPTVTAAATTDNKIEVTFSEPVIGVQVADFTFKNAAGTVVAVTAVNPKVVASVNSETVYVVELTDAASLSGNCTIEVAVSAVTDKGVRALPNAKTTLTVTMNDKVAPEISSALFTNETTISGVVNDADDHDAKIVIYFTEAMDTATLANKGNYILGSTVLTDLADTTVVPAGDGKSVTIIRDGSATNNVDFSVASVLKVLALKDLAGNTLKTTQLNADLGNAGLALIAAFDPAPAFATIIDTAKIELVATNQVKLYRAGSYLIQAIDPNKIMFAESATDVATGDLQVVSVSIAADGKSAVLTLNKNVTVDVKYDGVDAGTVTELLGLYADADAVTASNGAKTLAVALASNVTLVDKVAPVVDTLRVKADAGNANNNTIVLKFKETVSLTGNLFVHDIVVKDLTADVVLTPLTHYTIADVAGSTDVEIVIIKNGVAGHKFSVEMINGRYVTDANGNKPAAFAAMTVKDVAGTADATVAEKVAPTVTALGTGTPVTIAAAATATITFSEVLDAAGKLAVETALSAASANDGTYSWSGAVLTITGATGDTVYTGADVSATFTDLAGNSSGAVVIVNAN